MSKKLRNRFIALVCLLAFAGVGVLFYANWVVQKPFAIVLFLTDNLTTSTLAAARIYQNGAESRLNVEKLPNMGLITTYAADFAVSDTAAAATAIATGQKVNNRSLGIDPSGKPLANLFDLARKHGRATGLISNAAISDTSPAAFYARTADPQDSQNIAAQLVDAGNIDVILGGGEADFLPEHKEGRRKDGRDLLLEMQRRNYDLVRTKSELESIPPRRAPRSLALFGGNLAFANEINPRDRSQPWRKWSERRLSCSSIIAKATSW
jgi:alkaline phosphatase